MHSEEKTWHWVEGKVNRYKNHFHIYHNDDDDILLDDEHLVALVGKPKKDTFNVTFLIEPSSEKNKKRLTDVTRELNFYINDSNDPDAYRYLQYHCGTASNIYSRVHWTEFQARSMFERFMILFHLSIFVFCLWILGSVNWAYDNHPISTDDKAFLWFTAVFCLTSFIALVSLIKRLSWSLAYAKKIMYIQMIIIGLPLLVALIFQ